MFISLALFLFFSSLTTQSSDLTRREPSKRSVSTYTGYYGQQVSILPGRDANFGEDYVFVKNNKSQLAFSENVASQLYFVLEFNSKLTTSPRTGCAATQVCTQDVVSFKELSSGLYMSVGAGQRVVLSSTPSHFQILQKYSTLCPRIGPEYLLNVNNRNIPCNFPFIGCYGRCAQRKFKLIDGTKTLKLFYMNFKNKGVMVGSSTWKNYEMELQ